MFRNPGSHINSYGKKTEFAEICRNNGFTLNYKENKKHYSIFMDIFQHREYAHYFPFYERCIILDIGAHVGYFSLFAHVNTHPESVIHAIEPNQTNYRQLQNNMALNNMNNVLLNNMAIGKLAGEQSLYLGKSENHTIIQKVSQSQSLPVETTKVETLAGFIKKNKIERIDFLKMDCEGAEYEIFDSLTSDDWNKIHTIALEFHDLKDVSKTGKTIINQLLENKFNIKRFEYSPSNWGLNFGHIVASKCIS